MAYNVEQRTIIEKEIKENKIQIPIDDKDNWLEIDYWKVKSVYISTTNDKHTFNHLHPEFVNINNDGVEETALCNPCHNNINKKSNITFVNSE